MRYDYQRDYSCTNKDCSVESICRCSTISNICKLSVDLSDLTDSIYKQFYDNQSKNYKRDQKLSSVLYGGDVVDKYCIYRLLVYSKLYDVDLWNVDICQGYYGQEIGLISIDSDIYEIISNQIHEVVNILDLSTKLKYCLTKEYRQLLPDLALAEFELVSIYKSSIDFKKLDQNYINQCKQDDLSFYSSSEYSLPRGIVKRDRDSYTIIDGYHRILATDDRALEVFCIKS